MSKDTSAGMLSHIQQETTTLATCWEIVRQDGFAVRLTDHDVDIPFEDQLYEAAEGYTRTAIANSGNLRVDNLDLSGFLAQDTVCISQVYDDPEEGLTPDNILVPGDTPTIGDFTLTADTVIAIDVDFTFVPTGSLLAIGSDCSVSVSGSNLVATVGDGVDSVTITTPVSNYSNLKGTLLMEFDLSANTLRLDFIPDDGIGQVTVSELETGSSVTAWSSGSGGSVGSAFNGTITQVRQYNSTAYPVGFPGTQGSSVVSTVIPGIGMREEDIRAGLYDFSELRIFLVNFEDLTDGMVRMRRGILGEMFVAQSGRFQTEFRDLLQTLQTRLGENASPTCRADVGDSRCTVPIKPPVILRDQALTVGEYVRVYTGNPGSVFLTVPLANGDFELGSGGDVVPQSWSFVSGDSTNVGTQANLAVSSGTRYLSGADPGDRFSINQQVDLTTAGGWDADTEAAVDAGEVFLRLSYLRGTASTEVDPQHDPVRVRVEAISSSGLVLRQIYNSKFIVGPLGSWELVGASDMILPAATRILRFWLEGDRGNDTSVKGSLDNIVAELVDMGDGIMSPQAGYENLIYEVTTAGTTAGTQPTYNTTMDVSTADGTAILTAREAWTRHAVVASVTDRRIFTITVAETRAINDWFNAGLVTFESGDNARVSMEIKDWTQSSSTVELFLPVPNDIVIGDSLRLFPGCSLTRTVCHDKWVIPNSQDFANGNVINMRAEPDLPGKDAVSVYPDNK